MKLSRINMIFFKVFALINMFSINIVAMEERQKLDPKEFYPFVNFVNKTQYPINILLQSVQFYMSKPHTIKPNESVKLDLSEQTSKGERAPIKNLKIGYETGASSYGPMQDISKITVEIENKKRSREVYYTQKQETLHLKVTVEIFEDKSAWTPSLKYLIKYDEISTKGLEQDITKGSENTKEFDITKYRKQILGKKSIKELDDRFLAAIKNIEPKMKGLASFYPLFERYKKENNLVAAEGLIIVLENGDLNTAKRLLLQEKFDN